MKILFIITRADTVGGAQVHVRDLARELKKMGHLVQVVTEKTGKFTESYKKSNIDCIACPTLQRSLHPIQDFKSLFKIKDIIQQVSPDLVSIHSSKAGILGRLACFLSNQTCIFTAHSWAFTEGIPQTQRIVYRFLEQQFESFAVKIICVSEYDRNLGITAGMKRDRLVTIHNGMPDIPNSLRADPTQSHPTQLVMVARMEPQKDHKTLIQAISGIPNIKLQLVGEGFKQAAIQTQVQTLGLSDYVEFLGYREDIAHILAKAQIFLLISNWEGFPRTTLEAMRAGLPVIVSDVGGASEAVIEGQTGYCIPKGDVATLRAKILLLVNNPDLRQQMGQAARKHYEENFTFEQMFQKTLAIYSKYCW